MAVVNGYCSVEDVRQHIDDQDSTIDTVMIERAINAASRAIDNYCGFPTRRFWKDETPTVHEYTPENQRYVWIDDLASKTGLIIETGAEFTTVLPTTDYLLKPLNVDRFGPAYAWTKLELVGSSLFPIDIHGRPTVRITGIHGWSEIPSEVEQACILKAVSILKRKDAPFGVAGFGEFGTAVRVRADDPDVVDLLKSFVRYGAGTTG